MHTKVINREERDVEEDQSTILMEEVIKCLIRRRRESNVTRHTTFSMVGPRPKRRGCQVKLVAGGHNNTTTGGLNRTRTDNNDRKMND